MYGMRLIYMDASTENFQEEFVKWEEKEERKRVDSEI